MYGKAVLTNFAANKLRTTNINGFYVEVPTLTGKLAALEAELASSDVKKADKEKLEKEIESLRQLTTPALLGGNPPPPPPRKRVPLGGTLSTDAAAPMIPPPADGGAAAPSPIPMLEWGRAQRTFRVAYDRVNVRARPHMRAKVLEVLTKGRVLACERETDHWVKIRGGGWVLRAQEGFGVLLQAIEQQHYERKYAPAVVATVDRAGNVVRPGFTLAPGGGGSPNEAPFDELAIGGLGLSKRITVEKGKSTREGDLPPPRPPPRGWEIYFDQNTNQNYYASVHSGEARWTLGVTEGGRGQKSRGSV
mmetsp:Transcript_41917/g.82446  ORF Transcript_41917/g.82446 Transcript_41917/m.82446 type:complete len:306 (-) Transcript_41917:208-1125(-)